MSDADRLLELLECPFCGAPLRLEGDPSGGTLHCDCNGYPIVAGIPYVRTGDEADAAFERLDAGDPDGALLTLLGLPPSRAPDLARAGTFREALAVLAQDAEATYLLHRFSDPTFVVGDGLVGAVLAAAVEPPAHVLDLGGGAGHLTRSIARTLPGAAVVVADVAFHKLWLAKRFVAPESLPVCCDANHALPFARGSIPVAVGSDMFHYIWHKRGLAAELERLVGDGLIVLPHLHNALSWNHSEGMPLSPDGYRRLFTGDVRAFAESEILTAILESEPVDLSGRPAEEELAEEPTLALVRGPGSAFRAHPLATPPDAAGLNPLYDVTEDGDRLVLTLRFPSDFYAEEYAAARRYLPERATLTREQLDAARRGELDDDLRALAEQRVLLPLPDRYT